MAAPSLSKMAWRNLWRNKRRTILTLISIGFGVFLAVLFAAMQDQNWADMIDLAARLGGGHVTVQHHEYLDTPTLTRTVENAERLGHVAVQQRFVDRAVPRIVGQTMLSTASANSGAAFIAFDPSQEDVSTLSLLEALDQGEMFAGPNDRGIILGVRLADKLGTKLGRKVVYTMTDRDGEIVTGLSRVRGIIKTGSPSVDGGLALFPIGAVRRVLGYEQQQAVQVALFIADQRRSDRVADGIQPQLEDTVTALPWFESQPELAAFIAMKVGGARFMSLFIAVLVAAGIFNSIFVSVMERTREFGIMLAIGFRPFHIFRLVMAESLWLALCGLVLAGALTAWPYWHLSQVGIDMSAMLGEGGTEIAGVGMPSVMRVGIFPENLLMICAWAVGATLLAGLYPAWKAGRVAPVDSIRLV